MEQEHLPDQNIFSVLFTVFSIYLVFAKYWKPVEDSLESEVKQATRTKDN